MMILAHMKNFNKQCPVTKQHKGVISKKSDVQRCNILTELFFLNNITIIIMGGYLTDT